MLFRSKAKYENNKKLFNSVSKNTPNKSLYNNSSVDGTTNEPKILYLRILDDNESADGIAVPYIRANKKHKMSSRSAKIQAMGSSPSLHSNAMLSTGITQTTDRAKEEDKCDNTPVIDMKYTKEKSNMTNKHRC